MAPRESSCDIFLSGKLHLGIWSRARHYFVYIILHSNIHIPTIFSLTRLLAMVDLELNFLLVIRKKQ